MIIAGGEASLRELAHGRRIAAFTISRQRDQNNDQYHDVLPKCPNHLSILHYHDCVEERT